ncbi:hypothetical protein L3Q72_22850 [Vibrio sp. JC009]|uniref:hypothetical protein n=1 Tax=Vibrio sp. JC009 TaxID=2912314 RepID=UPI0023AF7030|nr:hypothetical protein [Vibrio sp. JC009]WED24072.1 hypothetical protein L3Q72_22850 [Vibrio sp. JC009]
MDTATKPVTGDSEIRHISQVLEPLEVIDEEVMTKMRSAYPHLRFTLCFEDELGVREPYSEHSSFDLHLVSAPRGSCSHLTFDVQQCTGLVIALHEE